MDGQRRHNSEATAVIDAISRFYREDNSNIHRGAHTLAARATDAYEEARKKVKDFLGAGRVEEIVFVRGTTEGVNLIANTYGKKFLQQGMKSFCRSSSITPISSHGK